MGEGPFPTELKNEIGKKIGKRGKEFGTVTNRKRRCGWLDVVLVKQSCVISGIDGIALTKIDVLDEFKDLYVCVSYKLNGKKIDYLPSAHQDQIKVKPIYKRLDGWLENTKGIKKWKDLPKPGQNIKLDDDIEEVTDIEELIQLGKNQESSINLEQGSGSLEESVLKKIKQK